MNERVVKLARRTARASGAQRAYVPRETRRAWARLSHKERGRITRRWRALVVDTTPPDRAICLGPLAL